LLFPIVLSLDVLLVAVTPHNYALLGPFAPLGIVTYAVFVGLGYSYLKQQAEPLPFRLSLFFAHLVCIFAVSATNIAALHGVSLPLPSTAIHIALVLVLLAGIVFLALACIPLRTWIAAVRETGRLWMYSLFTGFLAWCLRYPFQSFWDASSTAPGRVLQYMAFYAVKIVLRFFLPDIYVDANSFTIGTPRFEIIVAEQCSGLEGLGLVLAFTVIWLWYFRKESRFPQALLLIPCALISVWILNILRICILVLLGNAGYGEIAMVGFHSQAGWIAFTAVAFGFSMATRNLSWVRKAQHHAPPSEAMTLVHPSEQQAETQQEGESPATAAYLVPFLAILAASFVSKAASGYFEWLYPLRFLAAVIAIGCYWPVIKRIDWRFSWLAPVTGAAVALLWLVPALFSGQHQSSPLGAALAALSPTARWTWIAFRIAAAVITVPIAEEFAFRGYLARRLVDREFDTVPFSAVTVLSIALSSVAFGLMHGSQWIVGIIAGLAYAGVMKWRGRLSDAIVAHATSNLLLAIWVISRGDWSQW